MKLFSLDWFKSEAKKKLEKLQIEEQEMKNQLLKDGLRKQKVELPIQRPYKKIKLVNDTLTVVLNDGNIRTKTGATEDDFNTARVAQTENELLRILPFTKQEEEIQEKISEAEEAKEIVDNFEFLTTSADFVVKDGSVYMKPVETRSLPKLLVKRFIHILKNGENVQTKEYQALKKFWLKCCANPNAQSAEDLYGFLENHQFKIDNHGNFYAYRRVVSIGDGANKELVEFVSNAYNKIKGVWKKKPKDYYVFQADDGSFSFSKDSSTDGINKLHGNLDELYKNLPSLEENRYTSKHTGKEDYRVGEVISMPRNEGSDDNTVSCYKGFHAASKKYDYSGFGNTPILMIINPMDVLAVPVGEVGKLRTCRWFFAMVLPEEEKYILDDKDFDVSDLGDVFEEKCMTNLQEYIQNSFAEEVKRHTFNLPPITGRELTGIITTLEQMKEIISKRVNTID